jgi:nucleoside-diphosphate-sugar epimerase
MKNLLITGGCGQVGSDLRESLRRRKDLTIITTDIHPSASTKSGERYLCLDALDREKLDTVIAKYRIDTVFHLVGILSANGEKDPNHAWNVNINTLKNVLDISKARRLKVFWPSSIAVFGPHCPKNPAPQFPMLDPSTMYGITKVTGELMCAYYFKRYRVDVRSLRYPGLISYKTPPGGGTTDYAVDIFHHSIRHHPYTCFLESDTRLPMMYMDDAISATLRIMEADPRQIKIRTSYNIAALSFTPEEIVAEIRRHIPRFDCHYKPDYRQAIADSWPRVVDDSHARRDWGWRPAFDLAAITKEMLTNLSRQFASRRRAVTGRAVQGLANC